MQHTAHLEYSVEHEDEEYTVDYQATISVDNDYGADADGNRGIRMVEVEVEIEDYPSWCTSDADRSKLADEIQLEAEAHDFSQYASERDEYEQDRERDER